MSPQTNTIQPAIDGDLVAVRQQIHQTITGVTDDLDTFHFNRAVARIYGLINRLAGLSQDNAAEAWVRREGFDVAVRLIGPMMPHLGEELWQRLGNATLLSDTPWPEADPALLVEDTVTIAVQVKGRLRATIDLPRDINQKQAEVAALALPAIVSALEGKSISRVIFVPNKIISVVHV